MWAGLFSAAWLTVSAQAADIYKLNNTNDLNLGSSWLNGAVPGSADYGVWGTDLPSTANSTVLGANLTWLGIKVTSPGWVMINAGNTLAVGVGGLSVAGSGKGLQLFNTVLLNADQTWTLGGGNRPIILSGALRGTNRTLTITGPSYVDLTGSAAEFSGTLNYGGQYRLRLRGSFGGSKVALKLTSASSVSAEGTIGTVVIGDLATTNTGAILGNGDQNGSVTYEIGALGNNSTWAGTIRNGTDVARVTSLRKVGSGTWTLTGANTHTGQTTVEGGGLIVNNSTGSGTGSGGVVLDFGTTLAGSGAIDGSVTVPYGSSIVPGPGSNAIGTLTIHGSLDLGGTARFVLNRTNVQNSSRLAGLSNLNVAGTLQVNNVGPALQSGDSFTLFTATNYSGSFSSVLVPGLNPGLGWDTQSVTLNGKITVGQKPVISTAPQNQSVGCGQAAQFQVAATGSAPLSYQWSINGVPVADATNATFLWANVPAAQSNYVISVQAANPYGTASSSATLSLQDSAAPLIVTQPQSQTNQVGNAATFEVLADSCGPRRYQWFLGAQMLPAQTNRQLALYNLQLADAGNYQVQVSNSFGAVTSAVASLTVVSAVTSPNVLTLENSHLRVVFNTNSGTATVLDKSTGNSWNQVRWTVPEGRQLILDQRFEKPLGQYWSSGHAGVPAIQSGVPGLRFDAAAVYGTTNAGTPHLTRVELQNLQSMDRETYHFRFRSQAVGLRDAILSANFVMYDTNGLLLGTVATNITFGQTVVNDADWVERDLWIPAQLIPAAFTQADIRFDVSAGGNAAGSLYLTDVRLVGGNLVPYPGFTTPWGWDGWTGSSLIMDSNATPAKVLKVEAALIDPAHAYNREETSFFDYAARTYRVSFRYKTVGLKNLTVKARHNGLIPDRNLVFGSSPVTNDWTEYSYLGTTTNGGKFSYYFDFVPTTGAAGEFYLTDAEVVPVEPGPVQRPILLSSQLISPSKIQYTLNTVERLKANQPTLTNTLELGNAATNLNELVWQLIGDTNANFDTVYLAPAFYPVADSAVQWMIPTGEGALLPGSDIFDPINDLVNPSGGNRLRPWTHMMPMAFHGGITPEGDGYYVVNDTPVSTDLIYKPVQVNAQNYAYVPFLSHFGSKGKLQYQRETAIRFMGFGSGYVGMAKDYLTNYAIPKGWHVTYEQKAAWNPELLQYVGTPRLACSSIGVEAQMVADFRAAGITRATLTTIDPTNAQDARDAGWSTSRYDNYWDSIHPIFEQNDWLKRDANGNVTDTGWGTPENPLYICCPAYIEQVARQDIPLWNQSLHHKTWFIDVFGTVGPYSCYATNHPVTELDTLAARVAISRYVTEELGMIFWTEGAAEYLVPFASYGEGCMTSYGIGLAAPKYRIPLWSLVYHDCWENSWHTFGGNINTAYGWTTNDLYNILFGSKQLLGFTDWSSSSSYYYTPGLKEQAIQSIKKVTEVTRAVGAQEMTEHRFLSADGNVQTTRFANGAEVYVNFGNAPFAYGELQIPAQGYLLVNGSQIAAYAAWRDANFSPAEVAAGLGEPDAQPAGDGLSNFAKFAYGIPNPKLPGVPNWSNTASLTTGIRVSFQRARAELNYRVQTSSDLAHWNDYVVNPGSVGDQVVVSIPISPAEHAQFVRLLVGE